MKIKLTDIRLDGDTQPRAELNEAAVTEYAESLMMGCVFPPVVLFHDGVSYWLADGFHRYFAHKRSKYTEIEADVRVGTVRDALLYSVGANSDHGLRRTNEDKRRAVLILLKDLEWSEWSDREIARQAGVSNSSVHRIKKSLELESKTERKYEKNGVERVMKIKPKTERESEQHEDTKPDPIQEMASEMEALMKENKELKENHALETADISEEAKLDIYDELQDYRKKISLLENELASIKKSRDFMQNENAELKKQVLYWKKRCQNMESKAA